MPSRNPVLPPEYHFPDGEPHMVGEELYVYPSCDITPRKYCSDRLYVVRSRDLSHWTVEGPAFSAAQTDWPIGCALPPGLAEAHSYRELPQYLRETLPAYVPTLVPFRLFQKVRRKKAEKKWKNTTERLLYAPDALSCDGRSGLFFCTSDGYEGVAFADTPAGPFRDPVRICFDRSGEPIRGIDPAVFRDDDGKVYLYWGQIRACAAELTPDLTRVREDTLVQGILTEEEHGFHEASSVRKINGLYYFIFADIHRGRPTALGYATSESPLGPFRYRGIIVDNADCDPESWNNHGSIECVNGQWYVFYHRSTENSRCSRRMCAEKIRVETDGTIREVKPSSVGMGEPYRIGEFLPAYEACRVNGAYICGEKLVLGLGCSEVTYRYLEPDGQAISAVRCEGAEGVRADFRLQEDGELTLLLRTEQETEVTGFRTFL